MTVPRFRISFPLLSYLCFTAQRIQQKYQGVIGLTTSILTDTCAGRLFIIPSSFIHQCIVIPSKYLQAARYRDFQRHQHCLGSCHRQIVASLILDPLEPVILLAL